MFIFGQRIERNLALKSIVMDEEDFLSLSNATAAMLSAILKSSK